MDTDKKSSSPTQGPLARLKLVLVGTTHPGNIGASARAMKTMGLSRLCLVAPKFPPNAAAFALAAGANDILEQAETHASLAEAVAECSFVVGTTARQRTLEWPIESPRIAAVNLLERAQAESVALVFGREQSGLSNEELRQCHRLIRIPTDDNFSSLNLAQAVQVCAYELRVAQLSATGFPTPSDGRDPPAANAAVNHLFDHWLEVMSEVKYFNEKAPKLLPQRLRRILNKAELTVAESKMLRGFLTAIERALSRDGADR